MIPHNWKTMKAKPSKHFSWKEVECSCGRQSCPVRPPEEAAREMLAFAEKLREVIGRPLYLSSFFRCKEHNRIIGGAKNSQHLLGLAIDTPADQQAASVMAHVAKALGARGVKIYALSHVHIDLRKSPRSWFKGFAQYK